MKRIFYVLATALFCFAACDKQDFTPIPQDAQEDVYELVINAVDTKGSAPSSVELKMGSTETRTLTATLKKNGNPVSGASYSWTDPKIGNYYSGTAQRTYNDQYKITALKAGSGSYVSVTGYDGGVARATSVNIPINVAENDDVYEIVITYVGIPTPPDPSPVSLKMGKTESRTLAATLKKNGSAVSGASFTWYKSGGNYFTGSAGGSMNSQYTINAVSAGSGSYVYVTAKANPSAPTITSDNIYVTVAEADLPPEKEKTYRDEHIYFSIYLQTDGDIVYRGTVPTYLDQVNPLTFSDNFHLSYTIPCAKNVTGSGDIVLRSVVSNHPLMLSAGVNGGHPTPYGYHLTRDSSTWWYTGIGPDLVSDYCIESETATKISYVRYVMHLQ